MIIGYSILYIDEVITVKDFLRERCVIYKTWEESLKKAQEVAEKGMKRLGEPCTMVCLINSNSKMNCESGFKELVFKLNVKDLEMIVEVYIVPVFDS
jgi:hypothetical protein